MDRVYFRLRHQYQKCLRPIVSGVLPVVLAAPVAVFMLVAALGAFPLGLPLGIVTAAYLLLSIAYSRWIKHVVIPDVFSVAGSFVLRVMAGTVAIDVMMSHWLLIYLYLVYHKNRGGNPTQTLLTDGPLLLNVTLSAIVNGLIIYTANS